MTCSMMQRQIKMQVYHRRYQTCSPVSSGLSLPLPPPPFPPTVVVPSDARQLLTGEFRNSYRQIAAGSLKPGEHTHTTVTNATGHCHFSLFTKGHLLVTRLQRSLSTSRAAQCCYFSEEVFTFVWVKLQEFSTCAFLYLAEALLDGRPTLQFFRVPSNHCVLHLISLTYSEIHKGVQRHINQHAKKEYSWYMCYGIRQAETKKRNMTY